jgi:hypothetical protein
MIVLGEPTYLQTLLAGSVSKNSRAAYERLMARFVEYIYHLNQDILEEAFLNEYRVSQVTCVRSFAVESLGIGRVS